VMADSERHLLTYGEALGAGVVDIASSAMRKGLETVEADGSDGRSNGPGLGTGDQVFVRSYITHADATRASGTFHATENTP
jgi:hypothetical protein